MDISNIRKRCFNWNFTRNW